MLEYTFPTLTLPSFTVAEDAENYWNERLCYEELVRLNALAGFKMTQNVTADFAALDSWWNTQRGEIETALAEGGDGDIANLLPSLTTLVANFLGVSSGTILFFAKLFLWVAFKWLEGKNRSDESDKVIEILRKAFLNVIDEEGDPEDIDNLSSIMMLLTSPQFKILLEQQRGSIVENTRIDYNYD